MMARALHLLPRAPRYSFLSSTNVRAELRAKDSGEATRMQRHERDERVRERTRQ
jgi:hypothetical protein